MLHPKRREKNSIPQRPSRKQLEDAQQNLADSEKSVVLNQPHRGGAQAMDEWVYSHRLGYFVRVRSRPAQVGSKSEALENALGRFVTAVDGDKDWIRAGERYFGLVHRWRVLNDVPETLRLREGAGVGAEVDEDEMHKLEARIRSCNRAMKRSAYGPMGELAFQVTTAMVLDSRDPSPLHITSVKLALVQLAVELGL